MDWQQVAALGVVGLTLLVLLRGKFQRRKFDFHRDTPCGCSAGKRSSGQSITFRARKGQRPEIIVKAK